MLNIAHQLRQANLAINSIKVMWIRCPCRWEFWCCHQCSYARTLAEPSTGITGNGQSFASWFAFSFGDAIGATRNTDSIVLGNRCFREQELLALMCDDSDHPSPNAFPVGLARFTKLCRLTLGTLTLNPNRFAPCWKKTYVFRTWRLTLIFVALFMGLEFAHALELLCQDGMTAHLHDDSE